MGYKAAELISDSQLAEDWDNSVLDRDGRAKVEVLNLTPLDYFRMGYHKGIERGEEATLQSMRRFLKDV